MVCYSVCMLNAVESGISFARPQSKPPRSSLSSLPYSLLKPRYVELCSSKNKAPVSCFDNFDCAKTVSRPLSNDELERAVLHTANRRRLTFPTAWAVAFPAAICFNSVNEIPPFIESLLLPSHPRPTRQMMSGRPLI